MQLKRIITSALSVSLLLSTFNIGFAAEPNEVTDPLPNKGQSSITLEIKDTSGGGGTDPDNPDIPPVDPTDIIIATVPVELPIIMDLEGNVTVPTDAKIINHVEDKGIKVTKINTILENDWTAANYTDDFTAKEDNTKELGLSFRNDKMDTTGEFILTEDNWSIAANGSLLLNMQAKLPKQTVQGKGKIATVSFTLDWSGRTDGSDNVTPDNPDAETHTVTFTTDGKGILEGDTTVTVKNGETVSFPTAKPASIRYELSDWVEASSNSSVEPTTPIVSDVTIKAVFNEKAESPKNWFTTDGANTITGLSDEYLNMIDAPTDLIIPKTIGGSTIKSIGANAFANKDLITSVVIPNTIKEIGTDAFSGCDSLTELNLDYAYKGTISNNPFGLSDGKIVWAPTEAWDTNPMSLSDITNLNLSFDSTTGAIKALNTTISGDIALPTSVNGVKVTAISTNAFADCTNLISIEIPDTITSIYQGAFASCSKLTSITIPESVNIIGERAFYNCGKLENVKLPSGITLISEQLFQKCNSLKNLIIPNNVESIGANAFANSGIQTLILPEGVKAIGNNAFDTSGISNITIPNSVTKIGFYAFNKCTGLRNISLPNNITAIENFTFANCTNLNSVEIPYGVTGIGGSAFNNCTSINNLTVPDSVTYIGINAFTNVPHITYNGTATGSPWGAKAIN